MKLAIAFSFSLESLAGAHVVAQDRYGDHGRLGAKLIGLRSQPCRQFIVQAGGDAEHDKAFLIFVRHNRHPRLRFELPKGSRIAGHFVPFGHLASRRNQITARS
jgi:hypothetical protein